LDVGAMLDALAAIGGTIFVAELTDKDALLLLSLATTTKNSFLVFAAGAIAFTITAAIIASLGSLVVGYIPITWIKVAGGAVMLGYALFEYRRSRVSESGLEDKERRFARRHERTEAYALVAMIASLAALDLAGDATELLIIVFVAAYRNALLVFIGATVALVCASAVEVALGSRLRRVLSSKNIRRFSVIIFLLIGTVIVVSTLV